MKKIKHSSILSKQEIQSIRNATKEIKKLHAQVLKCEVAFVKLKKVLD